jgi:hypothetical protein
MNSHFNIHSIRVGDMIVRSKGVFSTHYMVYLGVQNGDHMVAENQLGFGVRIISLSEATKNNTINRIEPFKGAEHERGFVGQRVNQFLGQAYDLIAFNCEHFARLVAEGKVESKQVKNASNIALAGGLSLLTVAASKNNKDLMWLGGIMALAGAIGYFAQRNNS